jgi:hypothetical protein
VPKNLEGKIGLLLDDIQVLPRDEAIRRVKQLVFDELEFTKADLKIDEMDLVRVKSLATDILIKRSFSSSKLAARDLVQTFCYVEAVQLYLRSKDLIGFRLIYDKEERK